MNDTIKNLACSREIAAKRAVELKEAETKLVASPLWQQWESARVNLQIAKGNVLSNEADVRERALGIYEEVGDKIPHPAVTIKMYTVLNYEDLNALDYAREHLPKALKLDKRTFETAAKVLNLDFVTIQQEPRATIARDLSGYLPED